MIIEVRNNVDTSTVRGMAEDITTGVRDGVDDALETYVRLRFIERVASAAKKLVLDEAFSEVDDRPDGVFGASVKTRRVSQYDYKSDATWGDLQRKVVEAKSILGAAEDERNGHEAKMRAIDAPVANMDTGEVMNPAEYKGDKSSIVIKF